MATDSKEINTRLKPYNLISVFKRKSQIRSAVETTLLDNVMEPKAFGELVTTVHDCLPQCISKGVVFDSLKHLAGTQLTRQVIGQEAWRLAGNYRKLRVGTPVLPWRTQRIPEWVPVQIVDFRATRTLYGKIAGIFQVRFLAGSPSGMLLNKLWARGFCNYISRRMGFSRSRGESPFKRMEQFVKLRMYVRLEPRPKELVFDHVHVTQALFKFNQELIKARTKVDVKCPQKFTHACHLCPIGYDTCPLATHPKTYEKHICDVCGKDTWFDPRLVSLGFCVDCKNTKDLEFKAKG